VRFVSGNSFDSSEARREIEIEMIDPSFPPAVAARPSHGPAKNNPPEERKSPMKAKRRWFNPENEARNQFGSGWARYRQEHPDRAALYSGEAWRARRDEHLAAHPTCVVCGRKATTADHVVNLASGGTFDGPLQSLCAPCHRSKTLRESHEGAKRAAARRKET
jgi:5-methylcytosine-specific restriction endonuclease McrA